MTSEILLTDMGQCRPAAALSTTRRRLHWQLLPYETADFSGRLISAGFMTDPPEVRLSVGHSGWHAIYLGLWIVGGTDTRWGKTAMASDTAGNLKIRLADDPCFVHFRRDLPHFGNLEEMFWKVADLKGQDIVVSKQQEGFRGDASPAYVRLVPLDTTQVERLQADRNDQGSKCLIATNDAFGVFFRNRISSREGIWEQVEPYRNTDFRMIWWEIVSGMMAGIPAMIKTRSGKLLLPFQVGATGRLLKQGVMIRSWIDDGSILDWKASDYVDEPPERSRRGCFAGTLAELPDGHILMILRGGSRETQHEGDIKRMTLSEDEGKTWTQTRPITYEDGTTLWSVSSNPRLVTCERTGRLFLPRIFLP